MRNKCGLHSLQKPIICVVIHLDSMWFTCRADLDLYRYYFILFLYALTVSAFFTLGKMSTARFLQIWNLNFKSMQLSWHMNLWLFFFFFQNIHCCQFPFYFIYSSVPTLSCSWGNQEDSGRIWVLFFRIIRRRKNNLLLIKLATAKELKSNLMFRCVDCSLGETATLYMKCLMSIFKAI